MKGTGYASLSIQVLTGIVDAWGLTLPLEKKDVIYREILAVELFVQTIELCFYIWMVLNIDKKINITIYRYYDWFFSTPLMLITLCAFLQPASSLYGFVKQNKKELSTLLMLNALMLLCGWKSETARDEKRLWVSLGFMFWALEFSFLFVCFYPSSKHPIFFYFLVIWSFYGIGALLPYELKNNTYNLLDLLSKNGFGIYLTYVIYQKSKHLSKKKT